MALLAQAVTVEEEAAVEAEVEMVQVATVVSLAVGTLAALKPYVAPRHRFAGPVAGEDVVVAVVEGRN